MTTLRRKRHRGEDTLVFCDLWLFSCAVVHYHIETISQLSFFFSRSLSRCNLLPSLALSLIHTHALSLSLRSGAIGNFRVGGFLQSMNLRSVQMCHTVSLRLHQDISKTPLNCLHIVVMLLFSSTGHKPFVIEIPGA